jgi:hypothetical protein
MSCRITSMLIAVIIGTGTAQSALAQDSPPAEKKHRLTAFFDKEDPLDVTFVTNIKRIRGDRGDNAPWRSSAIMWNGPDGRDSVPVTAKTRGIWRRKHCDFPPVRLNFPAKQTKGTPFEGLDKPKLVSYCRDDKTYEQYVLQEYQLYRIYNLLTPVSHRARLLRLSYADSATGKVMTTRHAIILEEPAEMANRAGGKILTLTGARMRDMDVKQAVLVALFEYFIANTDFSISQLHNIELVMMGNGLVLPVAFDFDFSGAVNARYATVDPILGITQVRDRLYRGYCAEPEDFSEAFTNFNKQKPAI